ncbi:NADPH:quinone reductase [Purpureocillium takamizusanense]|uniref:Probable quinone oxidoreductase n=1 Tax=Purpureocillium takamizusanense TaxID=2060973 RepID=A0A9Q8V9K6_9HYPO|nr:NADPH:quinone reductase [Purpureocillium takamizusanense]UNI16791.1 NADPH:quinone reductase [Purpureocillium takamizusanense]
MARFIPPFAPRALRTISTAAVRPPGASASCPLISRAGAAAPASAAAPHRRHLQPSLPLHVPRASITTTSLSPAASSAPRISSPPPPPSASAAARRKSFSTTLATASASSPSNMAPLPATMKAIQIAKNGGVEVLELNDVPVPKPGPGQVLVRNRFSGVNFIDTYFRTGLYAAPGFPLTLGREAAGEVVAAGADVPPALSQPGTRVVYMDQAGYVQFAAVPADKLVVVPDALTLEHAAAAFLQGLSAWTFVREAGEVKAGQWTLVHAAAGGVGLLLVQMLRSVGAKVIGTASSEEKRELARKNGAGWTVDSHGDVVAEVKKITGGHGVDVIFDGVGKATFDADLEMIAMKGHLISFGNASGAVLPLSILKLGPKNVKLMRPVVNGYVAERADLERYSAELFDLIASGKVSVAIHKTYALKDVAQAHQDIESRKTTGKLLLDCE